MIEAWRQLASETGATDISAQAPELASTLLASVQREFHVREVFVERLSLGVAVRLGPGTVGLVAYPIE